MTGQAHFLSIRRGPALFRKLCGVILAGLMLTVGALAAGSETNWPPVSERLAATRAAFSAQPKDAAPAVQLTQVCFEASWTATNRDEKAKFAEEGIATARGALTLHPAEAGLEYYLALNLGQLASTRGMSALKLVREMETHLLAAQKLDEKFSDAGPDRSLGYLYLDAPGWPVSVGSNEKARKHLEGALKLAPLYPEHGLALAEACLRWKKPDEAGRLVAQVEAIWPKAREQYPGPRWAADWADWEKRLAALKVKLKPK